MNETDVERILSHDFSASAGAFCESLLARCLEVFGEGGSKESADSGAEILHLADAQLELIAAAGTLDAPEDSSLVEQDSSRKPRRR